GKALYLQYCAVCHGSRGLGDGPMAKATSPPATKLAGRQVREKSDPQLVKTIAEGMGSTMPAWRGILTDEQILDVVAYLRSLAG
ncbi:MAG: c-type cytochrome, partial [Nitrospirales bacterium]